VHAKGFLHGDSACLKFFRTHRSALNSAKLSGLAKFEAFHAIAEGPWVFLPRFILGFIFGRFCVFRQDCRWRLVVGGGLVGREGVLRGAVAAGARPRSAMAMNLGSLCTFFVASRELL
jgi:hypothetical protein